MDRERAPSFADKLIRHSDKRQLLEIHEAHSQVYPPNAGLLGPIEGELGLLQIRDQVSDAICVSDVDENDFGSIRRRRRELDATNADKSG